MANPVINPYGPQIPTLTGYGSGLFVGGTMNNYYNNNPYLINPQSTGQTASGNKSNGFNVSNLPSPSSFGSNSGGGIFSNIGNKINTFGAENLGTAIPKGGPLLNGVGPTNAPQATSFLGSSTATNILGGAGVGSLVAGITGGNPIAGGVGGAAGMVLGNAVLPGIGGWIGSAVLGGIGGKIFGGKKPSSGEQVGSIDLATGDGNGDRDNSLSLMGKKFNASNAAIRDQLRTAVSTTSRFLLQNGAKPVEGIGSQFFFNVNGRDGMWYSTGDGRPSNYDNVIGKDINAVPDGVFNGLVKSYNISNPELIAQAKQLYNSQLGISTQSSAGPILNQTQKPENQVLIPENTKSKNTFKQFLTNYKASQAQGAVNA